MNKKIGVLLLFAVLAAFGLFASPTFLRPSPALPNKLVVAATIFPLADITRQIAGHDVQVVQIIPSGSDPHSFNFSPQQIRQIAAARILFAIGHGLDNHITQSAQNIKPYSVLTVDRNIALREFGSDHEDSNEDPHYWLTVPNAQTIASTIAQELISLDPTHTAEYQNNLTNYLRSLDQLEQELQQLASQATQRNFIAVHDAWSYFAPQYGLTLVATYQPLEGRTPTIKDLQGLKQLIEQYQIKTFFTEPLKTTFAGTQLMQQDFDLKIATLDDIGGSVPDDSYTKLMLRNMQAIVLEN